MTVRNDDKTINQADPHPFDGGHTVVQLRFDRHGLHRCVIDKFTQVKRPSVPGPSALSTVGVPAALWTPFPRGSRGGAQPVFMGLMVVLTMVSIIA